MRMAQKSLKEDSGSDFLKERGIPLREISLKEISGRDFLKEPGFPLREAPLKGSRPNPVKPYKAGFVATGPYARVRKVLQLAPAGRLREKSGLIVSAMMLLARKRRLRDGSERIGGCPMLGRGENVVHGAYIRPQKANLSVVLLASRIIALASVLENASVLLPPIWRTLAS